MIHIGKEIEKRAEALKISITEFAEKINTARSNVYDIYSRKTIDTGLLFKISEVLEFDFFEFYINPKYKMDEIEELKREVEELKKEMNYLKKINILLEHQIETLKSSKN